jgi:hypothetical protein
LSYLCETYQSQLAASVFGELKSYAKTDIGAMNYIYEAGKDRHAKLDMNELVLDNSEEVKEIRNNNTAIDIGIQKYVAVKELLSTLRADVSDKDKLANFKNKFESHRSLIEKNRDNAGRFFLKMAASILLSLTVVGAFFVPKLWQTKGERLIDVIHDTQSRLMGCR